MGFFGLGDPELNQLGRQIKQLGGKIREIERQLRRYQEAQLTYHQSFVRQAPQSIVKSLLSFIESMPRQFPQHLAQLSSADTRRLKEELRTFCSSAAFAESIQNLMKEDGHWEHTGGSTWSVKRGHGLVMMRDPSTERDPFYHELGKLTRPIETICSKYSLGLGNSIRDTTAVNSLPPDLKNIAKDYAEMSSKVAALRSQLEEAQREMALQERDYQTRKVWKQS